jgi:hypothetical protein
MAKSPSPFAGMRLTDQTPLAKPGVDQQLFSRPSPLPEQPVGHEGQEPAAAPPKPPKAAPAKPQKREVLERAPSEAKGFDLNLPTQKSHTFSFTFEELFALQEVLTGLQRLLGLDVRITKIDIIRSALQLIVEDYRKRGEESLIVARIKTKKPVDRVRTKKAR